MRAKRQNLMGHHFRLNTTNLNTTGEFYFYALFDHYGDNTISIVATYGDKKPSQVDYVMYYVPDPTEYTPKAWALDAAGYAELLSNITVRAERTQVYVAIGTIQYFVREKHKMAVMKRTEEADGRKRYRIYGDVYSSYNGMPWLAARYTYK